MSWRTNEYRWGSGPGFSRRTVLRGGVGIGAGALALMCGFAPTPLSTRAWGADLPKRGGTLRYANTDTLKPLVDPATVDALGPSDAVRGCAEFLTEVDEHNLPHPHLLESLTASEDLKTWTLVVRKGPIFNTPTPRALDADDVVFNFKRWLDPKLGSSMSGLLNPYLDASGVEKVDDMTVRLHLKAPSSTLAYDLYHYAGGVMPREFEGDFIKQPWGTGPFQLVEYVANQSFTLKARKDYWRTGLDGQKLPYLDKIVCFDVRSQASAQIAGLTSGQFDVALGLDYAAYRALAAEPNLVMSRIKSAGTVLFRARVDQKPFDDPRVRKALRLVQDRDQIARIALGDTGFVGYDDLVAPGVDPAWADIGAPKRDVEQAKALLAQAGHPQGFRTEFRYPTSPDFIATAAQVYAQQCRAIGVQLDLIPMPPDAYWAKWTDWTFAAPQWSHRPLATMTMGLCLRPGAAWNETRYADPTFEALLSEVNGLIDVGARQKVYAKMQARLREDGPFGDPLFMYALAGQSPKVKGFVPTAFRYGTFTETWLA
jgi:peptide/nickel transport system substrate-binding protein